MVAMAAGARTTLHKEERPFGANLLKFESLDFRKNSPGAVADDTALTPC